MKLPLALLTAATVALTGCGITASGPAPSAAATSFQGRVHGGQQAVSFSQISLYAAGSTDVGQGATSLLRLPVMTDINGNFNISLDYTCPSATAQMYLVARGGNPGLALGTSNPALVLVAPLGDCGNLSAIPFIDIDEVTTVAAAWSLSRFTGAAASIGATSTNATGLRNAFAVAARLANPASGTAPGAGAPTGTVFETAKINTLANTLAPCVNSTGGASCTPLFSAATVAGVAPANVFDAALNIVRNPAANVSTVFNVSVANAPFQPVLKRAPNDWTMSITYNGGIYSPTALSVDASGNVWVANYYGGAVTQFSPTGIATNYGDPALYESYGLTIDPANNVWVTNQEGDPNNGYNGSLSKFSANGSVLSGSGIYGGGLYYPYSVAADTDGIIWVADFGHSAATLLNNDGTPYQGNGGYQSAGLPHPVAVALDASHNAWFAADGSAAMVTRAGVVTQFNCCQSPSAIEVDPSGNVWVADYAASSMVQLTASGAVLQRLSAAGGLTFPEGLAIDGAGNIWAACYRGSVIAAFGAAIGGTASPVLSPGTGFGVDAHLDEPFGAAVDASGSLWVTSFGNSTVTQFVGLAIPTRTPVNGPPTTP